MTNREVGKYIWKFICNMLNKHIELFDKLYYFIKTINKMRHFDVFNEYYL